MTEVGKWGGGKGCFNNHNKIILKTLLCKLCHIVVGFVLKF